MTTSTPRRLFKLLSIVLSAALVSVFLACNENAGPTLRLGTNFWLGYEPLYLARELGYLNPGNARIVEYPSGSEVIRAFRNQVIDGAALTLDEVLTLAQDGLDPKIVLVLDVSDGGDVVLGRPDMHAVKDLVGHRIAVENGAVGAYLLSRALMLNGLKASDIQAVPLEANEHTEAYKQGQVDGAVVCEPARSELLSAGANLLFDSSQIPGEIVDVLAIRRGFLEQHPDAVKPVLQAWFKALDYLKQHRDDSIARIRNRQRITAYQVQQALDDLQFPQPAEALRLVSGPKPPLVESGRTLMQVMLEQKLLKQPVDLEQLLAPKPLQSLSP